MKRYHLQTALALFLVGTALLYVLPDNSANVHRDSITDKQSSLQDQDEPTQFSVKELAAQGLLGANAIQSNKKLSMNEIFTKRRETVSKECIRHFGYDGLTVATSAVNVSLDPAFFDFTFYDDINKILFCTIPKVASTNIKEILLYLLNARPKEWPKNWKGQKPHIHRLSELSKKQIATRMNYTKIMFVRDPLERLISTWRDKFSRGLPTDSPELTEFGNHMLQFYRRHDRRNRPKLAGNSSPKAIPLFDFFQFIHSEGTYPHMVDEHWRPYIDHCNPCRVDYHYIGHFENLKEELIYIINVTTHRDISSAFPTPAQGSFASDVAEGSNTKQATLKATYLGTIPKQLVRDVVARYQIDFDIFGYPSEFNIGFE